MNCETLTVQLHTLMGPSYLGIEYEGHLAFPVLCDYCGAKEFATAEDAFAAVELAKWHGIKFHSFQVF